MSRTVHVAAMVAALFLTLYACGGEDDPSQNQPVSSDAGTNPSPDAGSSPVDAGDCSPVVDAGQIMNCLALFPELPGTWRAITGIHTELTITMVSSGSTCDFSSSKWSSLQGTAYPLQGKLPGGEDFTVSVDRMTGQMHMISNDPRNQFHAIYEKL